MPAKPKRARQQPEFCVPKSIFKRIVKSIMDETFGLYTHKYWTVQALKALQTETEQYVIELLQHGDAICRGNNHKTLLVKHMRM